MHEALLYEKLPGSRVRCNVCQWRCNIGPSKVGVCQVRPNLDGTLYILNYGVVSSAAVDPIEKKPLFHFHPGTQVFSLGTYGCNFHCVHCQNWQISFASVPEDNRPGQVISPQLSVDLAKRYGCQGIAWTYNEPGIWFEYTLDSAKLAKAEGLYTAYVTNGYMTAEALDMIGPYLDAYRVDIKGFSSAFYRKLARVSRWRDVLHVAKRAKEKWNTHFEVVTNIIPTMNDSDKELEGIATWIRDNLGELTPWHVTRFYPNHMLADLPPTPISTLERAYNIGKRVGLAFIYLGNVPGHEKENTECHSCHRLIIQRHGYSTRILGLEGSHCKFCGTDLNFRVDNILERLQQASS